MNLDNDIKNAVQYLGQFNNNNKILYDRKMMKNTNANGFKFGKPGKGKAFYVMAQAGSGMSFLAKSELVNSLSNNDTVKTELEKKTETKE
ncbi:MAG: hypothetical protein IKH75_02130 [Ruminococcus sp.]|nr:hypothetical protein [Ruminococcus sp.]